MDPRPSKQIHSDVLTFDAPGEPWFSTLWKDVCFALGLVRRSWARTSAQPKPNADYLYIHATWVLAAALVIHLSWTGAPAIYALVRGIGSSSLAWLALVDLAGILLACFGHVTSVRAWIAHHREERHAAANAAAITGYMRRERNEAASNALTAAAAFWASDAPSVADHLRTMAREYERAES